MSYISVFSIFAFYIFFFTRAIVLRKKIGKSIKAKDPVLNLSIFFAGLASILFILLKIFVSFERYFFVLYHSMIFEIIGTCFILLGLIVSSAASLGLGNSWRVGVDEKEKTTLVTKGIYRISRNPYFLSYDLVLSGLILSTFSVLIIVSSVLTMVFFHILILKEERYLEKIHGEEYITYRRKVRRYF